MNSHIIELCISLWPGILLLWPQTAGVVAHQISPRSLKGHLQYYIRVTNSPQNR